MTADLALIWPELILTIGGLITLMLGTFLGDRQVGIYQLSALLTLAAAAAAVVALDTKLRDELDRIGTRALKFFADPAAFESLRQGLADSAAAVEQARTTVALVLPAEKLDALAESLDGLSGLIAGFEQSDAQQRASLLGQTSQLYAEVNRIRAALRTRRFGDSG